MIRLRNSPIWLTAPPSAVFTVVSFTASQKPPFLRQSWNHRLRINQYVFDLWGIAAMGKILNSVGGLFLSASHSTTWACFVRTFSLISAAMCSNASRVKADWWGPRAIASSISKIDHGFLVCIGQPHSAKFKSVFAAG